VEVQGFEPRTSCLQSRRSNQLSYTPVSGWAFQRLLALSPLRRLVGLRGLEPLTSRLSGVCSNHLSYKPVSAPRSVDRSSSGSVNVCTACAYRQRLADRDPQQRDGYDLATSQRPRRYVQAPAEAVTSQDYP
jgi:hypothetical protein